MHEAMEMNSPRYRSSYQALGDLGDPSSYNQQQDPLYSPPLNDSTQKYDPPQSFSSPPLTGTTQGYEHQPFFSPPLDNSTNYDSHRSTWASQSTLTIGGNRATWNDSSEKLNPSSQGPDDNFRSEKKKVVLRKGIGSLSYLIHILAVGCTAAILQLRFREVYLADADDWKKNKWSMGLGEDEFANVLQFAAKLHEIFVVASASAIVFTIVRRRLIGHRGVPLGFLMGGYQLSSAEYLFSGGFWGPAMYAWQNRKRGLIGLSMVIGCTIVYANVVGPSSAVLIVPDLRWYNVNNPFNSRSLASFISGPHTYLYPIVLNANYSKSYDNLTYSDDCLTANMSNICPGSGHDELLDLATAYAKEGVDASLSMAQTYGRARRKLSANITKDGGDTVLIASTLHSDVTDLVGLFWHYVRTNKDSGAIRNIGRPQLLSTKGSDIFSPVVQVQCHAFDYDSARAGKDVVTYPKRLLKTNFKRNETGQGPPVPPEYWDFDHEYWLVNFTWVDLRSIYWNGQTYTASIGAVLTVPYDSGTQDAPVSASLIIPCVLDARWAATEIIFDPISSDLIVSNASDTTQFANVTNETALSKYGLGEPIAIEPSWARMLNVPDVLTFDKDLTQQTGYSAIEALFWPFIEYRYETSKIWAFDPPEWGPDSNFNDKASETAASILSLALADGLSRVSYNFFKYFAVIGVESDPNNLTTVDLWDQAGNDTSETANFLQDNLKAIDIRKVEFKVQRWGWGYGTETKTSKFAIGVLLLHGGIATFYILYGFYHWVKSKSSSSSWGNFGEIVALAMLSSPPKSLDGAGAGIEKWDTWKLDCRIREKRLYRDQVELLIGNREAQILAREGDFLVKRNKQYR